MGEVVYVQVVETADGKFVAEGRDSNRKAVEATKEWATAAKAAQDGADTWPGTPDHGIEVRHPLANDGGAEYGDDEPFKLAEAAEAESSPA